MSRSHGAPSHQCMRYGARLRCTQQLIPPSSCRTRARFCCSPVTLPTLPLDLVAGCVDEVGLHLNTHALVRSEASFDGVSCVCRANMKTRRKYPSNRSFVLVASDLRIRLPNFIKTTQYLVGKLE